MLEQNLKSSCMNTWGAKMLTTDNSSPCLILSWNEKDRGFGSSPGPLMKPLNHKKEIKFWSYFKNQHQGRQHINIEGIISHLV